jgi:hypothetical protein
MTHYDRYETSMYAGVSGSPYAVGSGYEDDSMTLDEARAVVVGMGWTAMVDEDVLLVPCTGGAALVVRAGDRGDCWDVRLIDEDQDTSVGEALRTAAWLRRLLRELVQTHGLAPIQADTNDR